MSLTCKQKQFIYQLNHFLSSSNIKHFKANEICDVGRKHGDIELQAASPEMWPHIIPTLNLLESLRSDFGKPVNVHSGYRDKEYNASVGGATMSKHLQFNAIDFSINGIPPLELAMWLEKNIMSFKLGIGLYDSFVHLDTRTLLGFSSARWGKGISNKDWWKNKKRLSDSAE